MKKSLTEKKSTKRASEKNKVELLAMREDMSEVLAKGWSITLIWETLSNVYGRQAISNNVTLRNLRKWL